MCGKIESGLATSPGWRHAHPLVAIEFDKLKDDMGRAIMIRSIQPMANLALLRQQQVLVDDGRARNSPT